MAMVFIMEYMTHGNSLLLHGYFPVTSQTDITDERYHELRLDIKKVLKENKRINQSSFEEEDDPDLEEDDPNIPLRRRDGQGPGDPEFKGTVECLRMAPHV